MIITTIDSFEDFKEKFIEECNKTGVLDTSNKEELNIIKQAAEIILDHRCKINAGFDDTLESFKTCIFAFVDELTHLMYVIHKDKYGHTAVLVTKCKVPPLNEMVPSYFHFLRFDNANDTSKYVQVIRGNKKTDVKTFRDVLKECVLENVDKTLKEDK